MHSCMEHIAKYHPKLTNAISSYIAFKSGSLKLEHVIGLLNLRSVLIDQKMREMGTKNN